VPPFIDPDGSDCEVLLVQISKTTATSNVNASTTSPSGPIVLSPISFNEVGIHKMQVVLWDNTTGTSGKTFDNFTINVTNTAPYFNVPVLPLISVKMNEVLLYNVTDFQDDEGHIATLTF
jgi:hypothetical protein